MNDSGDSKRIPKSKEEKQAFKALKLLEKEKRKEKSLQKTASKSDETVQKLSTSTEPKLKEKKVKIASDLVSSNEPTVEHISPRTDDEKAIKLLEKEKRKEKSLQNSLSKTDESELVNAVKKLSTSTEPKLKDKRVKGASDMVSFSDPIAKSISPRINDDQSSKRNFCDQNLFIRQQETKLVPGFQHLFCPDRRENIARMIDQIPNSVIPQAMKKLGLQLDSYAIRGSTLRCQQFLDTLKQIIADIPVHANEHFSQTFSTSLDYCVDFLNKCRPLSVTIRTAVNYLKLNLSMLNEPDHDKCRQEIIDMIDQFLTERIDMAHEYIKSLTLEYITADKSVLVYAHSQLVFKAILHAWNEGKFSKNGLGQIFVVDTFPDAEGQKTVALLHQHGIPHSILNLDAVPRQMPTVDLVILGAHSVMSNSNVVSRSGSASIANCAKSFGKKVIVCVETYKFQQSESFEYNELNNPDLLVDAVCEYPEMKNNANVERIKNWRNPKSNISVLDILYDTIPGTLVSGICCELGIISPTAVSYVSRVKQPY